MELMGQEMELNSALRNGREQGPEREAPAEVTALDSQGCGDGACELWDRDAFSFSPFKGNLLRITAEHFLHFLGRSCGPLVPEERS